MPKILHLQSESLRPVSWENLDIPRGTPPLAAAVRLISSRMCRLFMTLGFAPLRFRRQPGTSTLRYRLRLVLRGCGAAANRIRDPSARLLQYARDLRRFFCLRPPASCATSDRLGELCQAAIRRNQRGASICTKCINPRKIFRIYSRALETGPKWVSQCQQDTRHSRESGNPEPRGCSGCSEPPLSR